MDRVNEDGNWSRANTVDESDIQDGYIYDLVIQASRSSDGIFKEVVYKLFKGYPSVYSLYSKFRGRRRPTFLAYNGKTVRST